jgi:hypothetical protein
VSLLKLLSLLAFVVAIFAAQGASDRSAAGADRSELPAGQSSDPLDDDSLDADDVPSLTTLPLSFAAPLPILAGPATSATPTDPATSDHLSLIFRPPISTRA